MCWNRIIEDEQSNLKREPSKRELHLNEQEELSVEAVEIAQDVPELA